MAAHLKNNLVGVLSILIIFAAAIMISGAAQETRQNSGGAFTIELIHRDSPASPLYDSLLSQRHRMKSAFHDSLGRLARNDGDDSPASVRVLPDPKGTYLVRFSVGAAPAAAVRLAVADTGSDLIWLQCRPPCRGVHCSGQNDSLVFSPDSSGTYKPVHCGAKECTGLPGSRCDRANKTCLYYARYNDGTYSHGEIAKDTFTLDLLSPAESVDFPAGDLPAPAVAASLSKRRRHNVSFPNIIFGCGQSNHFGNNDTEVSGIVGLGSSPYSLVSQIGGHRFSYCLVPLTHLNVSSKLQFGSLPALALQGFPGVVSTPLILKPQTTFYYLTLLGFSVENRTVEPTTTSRGNIYIDSGTTFTFLPVDMYAGLEEMVKKSIGLEPTKPDPRRFLGLCYQDLAWEDVPTMTARFEGGEVRLNPVNTFVNIGDGVGCLAFAPTKGVPVFGNVAHTNFLVEYDLEKMVVSFMPTDCVKWKY